MHEPTVWSRWAAARRPDSAKAIAHSHGLPIIAVPTTYAGSEQTAIYGITGGRHKQTGKDPQVQPRTVIYDPELTFGLPPQVTGPSAFNALAHSVEALYAPGHNPVINAIAMEGVRAIHRSLPIVMARPTDLPGRSDLLYGAYLSGMALGATAAAFHHKICHVLGGAFNLVHADSHSVILPHAIAFNAPALPDEMQLLGEALALRSRRHRRRAVGPCRRQQRPHLARAAGTEARRSARGGAARHRRDHHQPAPVRPGRHVRSCSSARSRVHGRNAARAERTGSTMTVDAFIIDAVRTPFGRIGGALAGVRPDDLAAGTLRSLLDRSPGLDSGTIDEIYVGDANQAGEDNRNVGRMASLLAGLPTSVPGATVNRLCGSGLDAIFCASRTVAVGDADIAIAGGVESMSRAPWVLQKPAKGYPTGHEQLWSTTLGWRMTNPKMPQQWTVALGEGAELLADLHSIGRDEQDEFALRSHQSAAAAWDAGWFDDEVVPVAGIQLARDECIRADTTLDKLAALRPVFRPDGGSVTAGNSSPMNDGSSMLLLASEAGMARAGATPMARVVSRATSGVDPHLFGIGPVESVRLALKRAGLGVDRSRCRRAERGVRRAEPGVPA